MKDMKNELDQLIFDSMKLADKPTEKLNHQLKTELYKREAMQNHQTSLRTISLWYVPMILNFLTFSMLAILALLMITNPFLSKLAAFICMYISFAGIILTAAGMKRTKIKEEIAVHIKKRGVLA